jgi:hypothetical protein
VNLLVLAKLSEHFDSYTGNFVALARNRTDPAAKLHSRFCNGDALFSVRYELNFNSTVGSSYLFKDFKTVGHLGCVAAVMWLAACGGAPS